MESIQILPAPTVEQNLRPALCPECHKPKFNFLLRVRVHYPTGNGPRMIRQGTGISNVHRHSASMHVTVSSG